MGRTAPFGGVRPGKLMGGSNILPFLYYLITPIWVPSPTLGGSANGAFRNILPFLEGIG